MRAARWKIAIGLCGLIWGQCASAVTTIGDFTFEDNAFADSVGLTFGSFTTDPSGTLEAVLTDIDETTGAFSNDLGAFVELGFTDNGVVNGDGADIVLFETGTGSIDRVEVALSFTPGTGREYSFSPSTSTAGLNQIAIDLTDFGLLPGENISSLIIELDLVSPQMTVPLLTLVGALNTGVTPVPVPAAVWMFGSGLIGLVGIARRRRT